MAIALLSSISVLNLYLNFRSLSLICFLCLCCVILVARRPQGGIKPVRLAVVTLAIAAALIGFQQLYVTAVKSGSLGFDALQKYDDQSTGDLGLLLGGRSESLASLQAIADSPLIGHGSWAKDSYYVNLLYEQASLHGYSQTGLYNDDDAIPTHSHLLGAWVEGGFLGGLFWIWVLLLTARRLIFAVNVDSNFQILLLFCGISLLWDVLFSPLGTQARLITPYYLVVITNLRPVKSLASRHDRGRSVRWPKGPRQEHRVVA